ncbi:MAG: PH domain-containing protein [Acetobacterium woodii]|nr:PH domain-containing protein [Acetobacterium woodii]
MAETSQILLWTFISECPIPEDVQELLVEGEEAVAAYKTIRDSAVFTNKRLIVRDAQGLSGKKVEVYSLPYSSINMWSTENAGKILDLNAEVELWTRAGHIKVNLRKGVDVRKFDRLIANAILRNQ